jgi:acyl-coenzyme A synthetase/AMP-(fatty) acid ligase
VYGCTETNNSMIYSFTGSEAADLAALPLGRPLPGVWVYLRTHGHESTDSAIGELVVSTPFQTSGYLADDQPGARFVTVGGRTWYRTGDLVSRDAQGALTLVGRTDFQVKVRGVRVNIEEIEQVLLSHDDVREAAVVALPDPAAGTRLHAVVRAGPGLTGLGLRAYCAGLLNRAAIPTTFKLTDESLPVGPTGKVNRSHLRQQLHKELT